MRIVSCSADRASGRLGAPTATVVRRTLARSVPSPCTLGIKGAVAHRRPHLRCTPGGIRREEPAQSAGYGASRVPPVGAAVFTATSSVPAQERQQHSGEGLQKQGSGADGRGTTPHPHAAGRDRPSGSRRPGPGGRGANGLASLGVPTAAAVRRSQSPRNADASPGLSRQPRRSRSTPRPASRSPPPARRSSRPTGLGGVQRPPQQETEGLLAVHCPSGGCHSSMRLPAGSITQPNLPNSDSSTLSSTAQPSSRRAASTASRSSTR